MTIFRKQNGFKQFLALLVVFTLICPGVLSAKKEKRGAWLKVTTQDMQVAEGEFLYVKDSEIILMSNSKTGITIPLTEIRMIEYKKKGKFGTGFSVGIGISMVIGGISGARGHGGVEATIFGALLGGVLFGIPSGLLFGVASSRPVDKTFNFRNAPAEQVSKNLEKLKTLARF
ncbi:MAG TPA: hypothetical protein VK186_12980 [Candidatus Deferrimicrobium sp.]|nr:hypothetical protein [Candidatus Deferrimicrobium sp.]